eukprot:g38065.t1
MSKRQLQTWEDRQGAKKKFEEKARSALGFSAPSPTAAAASCGTSSTQPSSLNLPGPPAHFSHPPSRQESKESCVVLDSVRGDVQDGLHIAFQEAKKSQVRSPDNPSSTISAIDRILSSLGIEAGQLLGILGRLHLCVR